MSYRTSKDVLEKSKNTIGKTFGELDKNNRLYNPSNKGMLGQVIEESVFEYKINSLSQPDFIEAKVELKVTPYKINKNGTLSAKERLVLNIINYVEEAQKDFYNSSFWKKNKTLLIMYYLYEFDKLYKDMQIEYTFLHEFTKSNDLEIIKQDYKIIHDKILAGKAHEISEADTMYLAACTKGANRNSVKKQPFSNVMAQQRAYSLKQSYMSALLREHVYKADRNISLALEPILKEPLSNEETFENYIESIVSKFYGESTEELFKIFKINTTAKSKRAMLISRILNINSISNSEEFIKSGMKFKTIHVESNWSIKESMSFPSFNFCELANEEWETSTIRNMFLSTKFVFAVFKKDLEGIERFYSTIFWKMPLDDLDIEYKKVFDKTKRLLKDGNIVREIKIHKGKITYFTNFPKSKENRVGHVRPHAKNRDDVCKLPINDNMTSRDTYPKHCFWLNKKYIIDTIQNKK